MKLYTLDNQFIKETKTLPSNYTGMIEYPSGRKDWLKASLYHRLDGPAIEWAVINKKEYWVDGKQYMEEQHALLVDIMKLKGLTL